MAKLTQFSSALSIIVIITIFLLFFFFNLTTHFLPIYIHNGGAE